MKIIILMILCHILDDFVLQPVCLSNLKQKKWWEERIENLDKTIYKNDFIMALFIHSLSWSCWILLPWLFFDKIDSFTLLCCLVFNTSIHFIVDDVKANEKKISLFTDQCIHLLQIIFTFFILYIN